MILAPFKAVKKRGTAKKSFKREISPRKALFWILTGFPEEIGD